MFTQYGQLQFEDKWPTMHSTVLKLLQQEPVLRNEWQDLIWSLCVLDANGATKVHQALLGDILDFISNTQSRILLHEEDSAMLKAYVAEWRKFFAQCEYLPKVFTQLEATLSAKSHQSKEKKTQMDKSIGNQKIRRLMLDSWNQRIFSNIKYKLHESAMKLLHAERNGRAFDSQLVIGLRESSVNLSCDCEDELIIYRENFEKAYLEAAESFYKSKAPEYMALNGVQEYMKYADVKLKEEEQRAMRYLEARKDRKSIDALVTCCVNVLVTPFKDTIISECPNMIKINETDNLHLMFSLMDRIEHGTDEILRYLEEDIRNQGIADMISATEAMTIDCELYVGKLLELFKRYSILVKRAFADDQRFLASIDRGYKRVVNDTSTFKLNPPAKTKSATSKTQPESKCPELLANYCDMLLRKTALSKKMAPEEVECKLGDVLLVLKYVENKDVFMRYHKAHLARRLILDSSVDIEMEENMVKWLRVAGMPAEFVNKLARMFQDIKVSEDLNQEFKEADCNKNQGLTGSINVKILDAGTWARSSDHISMSLPMILEDCISQVEEFYRLKHWNRKLEWHHLMSNGIIAFSNDVGKFDLEVTTFQMAVLFAWNQRPKDRISYECLKLTTELPDSELRKTLFNLVAFSKLKRQVLLCVPESTTLKDFTNNTVFWVNQEFCLTKPGRIQKCGKMSLIGDLQLSTECRKAEDNKGIIQLRIFKVQETIIKILKMRKHISNAALQTELREFLKNMFVPSKKMIEDQIDWLIENECMRRNDINRDQFIYIA